MSHTSSRHGRFASIAAMGIVSATLVACGGSDEPVPVAEAVEATTAPYGLVDPATAAAIANGDVTVIDVRTPNEYAEGHLKGATLIDFYSDTFADEVAELDPDGEYLVYCRSGNRSGQAVAIMDRLGFDQVWDVDGGILAWGAEGLPLDNS